MCDFLRKLGGSKSAPLLGAAAVALAVLGRKRILRSLGLAEEQEDEKSLNKDFLATPATCRTALSFDVPESLPSSDADLFSDMLPRLQKEIVDEIRATYEMPSEAVSWVDEMIAYTVAGGKMNRGLSCVSVMRTLASENGREFTPKDRIRACALGWCIEFLQAFFLVADDLMDGSITRRGQPCWYRRPDVKLIAINDSFILESSVYMILKRYFGTEYYYPQLVDLFLDTTRQTELGQLLDLTSQPQDGSIDLSRFTTERYMSIVKYKTAFYSFYLPVACGMITAGITDREQYKIAKSILCTMGEYFQIQDDYLDCYGKPEVIGKVGTDIQDNKCSWLVVQALKVASPEQRKVLADNYGQDDSEKIAAVKALYAELGLERVFQEYEERSYKEIKALISQVDQIPSEVFEFLLRKIYKRSK